MDRRFVALVGLGAMLALASAPAAAQQKTAKQCNDEWTANKATIQASGKTKKAFIAECRGQATGAATPAAKPAGAAPKPATTAAPSPAATVKTAKQCNDEWTANKAAIQATKKTKKEFMAECRTQPASAPTTAAAPSPVAPPPAAAPARPSTAAAPTVPPTTAAPPRQPSTTPPATTRAPATATAPAAAGQFSTEAQAKARCPSDTVVWVNTESKIYHFATGRNYGSTKSGAYMCERDATAAGARAAKNEKRP
jgi:hypothetical protein